MIDLGSVEPNEWVGHDVARSCLLKAQDVNAIAKSMRKNLEYSDTGLEMSVNRVSTAESRDELHDLLHIIATRRTLQGQEFQGWGMILVDDVEEEERKVVDDPKDPTEKSPANPYHALIVLPDEVKNNKRAFDRHINRLATLAYIQWKAHPYYEAQA